MSGFNRKALVLLSLPVCGRFHLGESGAVEAEREELLLPLAGLHVPTPQHLDRLAHWSQAPGNREGPPGLPRDLPLELGAVFSFR